MASDSGGIGRTVASVCCYCGTGCGVSLTVKDGQLAAVDGDASHPANFGRLCSKGRTLGLTVRRDEARVLSAKLRGARGEPLAAVPLTTALDAAADRLADIIRRDGPDAVAFYLSGQLLTEDYVVFNQLARGLVGTRHIDSNSRLCMSSAVSAYKASFGADAPPCSYEDLDFADCVLIAGANPAYAHPVLFRRLEEAKARRPGMKVVVIDPRRTDSAELADLHLAIAPGTDVVLFHAMLNQLVWDDLIDEAYVERHCEGYLEAKSRVREFTPELAAGVCGVAAADIVQAARWFGEAGAALSLYTMGLNQSAAGVDKNRALINLHLACGQIGKPGAGPFSLTGQPNAMGGREAGAMATLLPGHRDPDNAVHRAEVAAAWGVASLPEGAGLTAVELFDAVGAGRVKAVWIAATNPAASLPEQAKVRAALQKAELVIVSEAFAGTDTLAFADIVLPAATWPEKDGTLTNSERRVSRVRAALPPPGDAQADWQLACAVGTRLAARIAPERAHLFAYTAPADIFAGHAALTAGRDLDYSALSHALLDAQGPQQWPFRQGAGQVRLYTDGVFATEGGRARFAAQAYTPVADVVNAHFPLRLTSGRLRDQWHTAARTSLAAPLLRHVEAPALSMNPADLARLRLAPGALARVRSRRGELVLPVAADETVRAGHAFVPMHWGRAWMAGDGVNVLMNGALDPVSRQPELKHAAVAVTPANLGWQAEAFVAGDAPLLRGRLANWLGAFPFAQLVAVADAGGGVWLRVAAQQAPDAALLSGLAHDFGVIDADLKLDDAARGVLRRVALDAGRPRAWLLCGDTRARDALRDWADGGAAPQSAAALFGAATGARARVVCACMGVREDAIDAAIRRGADLAGLKQELGCGTGCGSCVPEINGRLNRVCAV